VARIELAHVVAQFQLAAAELGPLLGPVTHRQVIDFHTAVGEKDKVVEVIVVGRKRDRELTSVLPVTGFERQGRFGGEVRIADLEYLGGDVGAECEQLLVSRCALCARQV
jgi:hypothetical protein